MKRGIQNKIRVSKHLRLSHWIGGLSWAIAAWWFFFPPPRTFVESRFSRGWYRRILEWATPLTQRTEYPIVLVLLIAGCFVFLVLWTGKWIRVRRIPQHSRWTAFLWGVRSIFAVSGVLVVWFIGFWGAGYRRLPVEQRFHLAAAPVSDREAGRLQELLLEQVKRNLIPAENRDAARAVRSISSAMARLAAEWDGRPIALPSRVKPVPGGLLMSGGTSGVCSPFTLEALVDRGLPGTAFVHSAAHELGHVAGFCPEDETSFAGYLAGMFADDPFARYACALSAYVDLTSRLKAADFETAYTMLPEPARQDLAREEESYRKYRIAWFHRISREVYDRYLQAQGIKEGVQNYSHGITLLVYAGRKGMLKPLQE